MRLNDDIGRFDERAAWLARSRNDPRGLRCYWSASSSSNQQSATNQQVATQGSGTAIGASSTAATGAGAVVISQPGAASSAPKPPGSSATVAQPIQVTTNTQTDTLTDSNNMLEELDNSGNTTNSDSGNVLNETSTTTTTNNTTTNNSLSESNVGNTTVTQNFASDPNEQANENLAFSTIDHLISAQDAGAQAALNANSGLASSAPPTVITVASPDNSSAQPADNSKYILLGVAAVAVIGAIVYFKN